jgi:hypothetical protein
MAFNCSIPARPTVQQDDAAVRITRWDFVIMLSDAVLKVHDGERATEVALTAGQSYRRPAGVRHDVMNGSDHPIAFVEIEVKRADALFKDA